MVDNIVFFCLEVVFAFTILLILLIELLDTISEQQRYTYIGYTIILLLALMIIARMILTLVSVGFIGYKAVFGKKVEEDPLTKFRKQASAMLRKKKYTVPASVNTDFVDNP